ncbi:NusG domain II-containing protein [Clostridium gasigenes]|uniref:NusG domain II-containing protein n=1 Tax=Clostridium gasigenes TaxID=94869 RepID=UPI001C0DA9BB|nr:NusG domain II-containing protein [Clostridium gasigenes]MBU3108153.1 NusG domain II-containing protein [Clostridium gasigenes]
MFKKWDIIIIVVLMVLSFIPEIVFGLILGKEYNSTYAEITVAGEVYKNIPLSAHKGKEIIEVETKYGKSKIQVKDNNIGIIDASCADKICMHPEYINKPGDALVCLPNKLMIEIKGDIEEDIIISH